jgi:hypothetical protein
MVGRSPTVTGNERSGSRIGSWGQAGAASVTARGFCSVARMSAGPFIHSARFMPIGSRRGSSISPHEPRPGARHADIAIANKPHETYGFLQASGTSAPGSSIASSGHTCPRTTPPRGSCCALSTSQAMTPTPSRSIAPACATSGRTCSILPGSRITLPGSAGRRDRPSGRASDVHPAAQPGPAHGLRQHLSTAAVQRRAARGADRIPRSGTGRRTPALRDRRSWPRPTADRRPGRAGLPDERRDPCDGGRSRLRVRAGRGEPREDGRGALRRGAGHGPVRGTFFPIEAAM